MKLYKRRNIMKSIKEHVGFVIIPGTYDIHLTLSHDRKVRSSNYPTTQVPNGINLT